jgi:poly-gamma-glutamate synthesis protein (capsule biosynthesis protein)
MRRRLVVIAGCVLMVAACAGDDAGPEAAEGIAASQSTTTVQPATTTSTTTTSTTTTTTTTSSTTTTTTLPPKGRVVITGVGDTNLDPNYIKAFRTEGYGHAFTGLQDIFLEDDLTVVNLECAATSTGRALDKAFTFNCDLDALPVLVAAGVEVANLGNNHSGDFGEEALVETRANVAAAGLAPVGVGVDSDEAHQPALFDVNGWRIAVLGFGGVVPWDDWIATADDPGMADGDDIESMVAAVRAADEVADLVFVSIHWGVELDTTPRQEDIERAHAMIDAGADGIFGHHPHRLQPLDFYEGRPIAWSLGNFVWPRLSAAGATTAVAQFIVEPDGSVTGCLIPTVIESHGHPVIQVEYHGLCNWD